MHSLTGPCLMHSPGAGGSPQGASELLASRASPWPWRRMMAKMPALGSGGLIKYWYHAGLSQWKGPKD